LAPGMSTPLRYAWGLDLDSQMKLWAYATARTVPRRQERGREERRTAGAGRDPISSGSRRALAQLTLKREGETAL
jgi:hypothetical protein